MALNVRNPETDRLAEDLARETGVTKTEAVTQALRERLERVRRDRATSTLADELDEIVLHFGSLPDRDLRSAEEILGYDEHGLPS